jgi:hypothetical protein
MMLFPTFHVIERRLDDDQVALLGSVSATEAAGNTWVADRYLGYLKHGDSLVYGRWHSAGDHWKFVVDKSQNTSGLSDGNEFEILDSYWGERVELVLNRGITWRPDSWTKSDDHDHCSICWATISIAQNENHFLATTHDRVCTSCYKAYVRPRALDFIAAAA